LSEKRILVTGAGGFIGGHLVGSLAGDGMNVRAVDVKSESEWYQIHPEAENLILDLRRLGACREAVVGMSEIYNLSADMGGMGFIENNKAACMLSVLINTHLLEASVDTGVDRFLFTSSACVYAAGKQDSPDVEPLREGDAYPAMPEDGYGWEKLFSERMCRHFQEDFGLQCRMPRYHNVYGPQGTWEGGREKAPAAICRKIAQAELSGNHEIEIWGDGEQTRSFTYIGDCVYGTRLLMDSYVSEPINLGSSQLVTINQLVDIVERTAGIEVKRNYDLSAPQGVRGRNSDNAMILDRLGWEPTISLEDGLEKTYAWIRNQLAERQRYPASVAS
jgi:nucleoside-diphosphate-sugar epimerase